MTSARDREHDKWIPWYVEDTPGWLELSLAARGAMEGIARKLNDKTGKLVLRRGLSTLAVLLHVRWEELEPAIAELIAKGKITWDGSLFTLEDPEYMERKRRSGADRVADHRARKKADVTPVTLQALPPLPALHVTDVTPVLVSSDLVSSDSDLVSETRALPARPPAWFVQVIDMLEQVDKRLPELEAWLRYEGHRAGKNIDPTPKDAQYWLSTVMIPERRKEREEARRRDDADSKRTAAFVQQRSGPEVKPQDSRKQFRERDEWERTAGPPDPETAAKMRALLGKVGT